jgi:hypothetical protein
MSTKTTFKRIALVAVAALGFGMLSVAPSSAAASTAITIAKGTTTDASQFVVAGTMSLTKATALGTPTKVYVTGTSVTLNSLTVATSGAATANSTLALLASDSSGTITEASGANVRFGTDNTTTSGRTAGALGTATSTTIGASAPTAFTASADGTWYALYEDNAALSGSGVGAYTAGTDPIMFIVLYSTSATTSIASSAVTGNGAASPAIGPNGQAGAYRIRFTTPNTTDTVNPAARITSVPAGSKILNQNPLNGFYPVNNSSLTTITKGDGTSQSPVNGSAAYLATSATTLAPVAASAAKVADTYFYLWPDVAGTYTVVFFDDRNSNGIVDGNDVSATVSYVVGGAVSTATITNLGGDAPTTATNPGGSTEYGALLKVTLKDAAGLAVVPNGAESVTVTASGSGQFTFKNGGAISAVGSVSLTASDFNGKGEAFLNLSDATAETVTVSISGNGSMASVANSTNVVFRAAVVSGAQFTVTALQTTGFTGSAAAYTVPLVSSVTWTATGTTSTATTTYYQAALIKDSAGNVLGTKTNNSSFLYWEVLAANGNADATVPGSATWKIAATGTTAIEQYRITGQTTINTSGTDLVVTSAAPAITSGTITWTPSIVRTTLLGTVTHVALVKDQFGKAVPNASVTFSRAGRNPSTVSTVVVTDSLGKASYTTTDAAASTVATLNDVITASVSFLGALGATTTLSSTASINYSSTAATDTVTLTVPDTDSTIAGTVYSNISAGYSGPSGTTVTALVKDASGSPIAGVLVTFTVAGLTGAEILTSTASGYTDANGKVTSSVASYAAGKATVTATAGTKTATGDVYFKQLATDGTGDTADVRTISATVSGNVVSAVVKDRYGNTMEGIRVYATRTGTGYFGTGSSSTDALTDKNGVAEFLFTGTGSVTVKFASPTTGQSSDAAGYVGGNATTGTAVTAAVAGTATTNQKGIGSTLAPAGVNSVTVAVEAGNAATDAATAAADAAAEATDAANAATDAANAAAEAADAATAAAQDAADAVAALSTQVSEMIDALKKQITALTNLVIKIQKKVKA